MSIILPNGHQQQKPQGQPALVVYWDDKTKSCTVVPDPRQILSWDFAACVLQMGLRAVEKMARRMEQAEHERLLMEAAHADAVRKSLGG